MTSNIGTSNIGSRRILGYRGAFEGGEYERMKRHFSGRSGLPSAISRSS